MSQTNSSSDNSLKKIFIQFGGTGDLAQKKLIPAYYELYKKGQSFSIISLGRRYSSRKEYLDAMVDIEDDGFLRTIDYVHYDISKAESNRAVAKKIEEIAQGNCTLELIYYIALQPELYETAIANIEMINEFQTCDVRKKIVVEKPFGFDLESAKKYNSILETEFFDEEIYRVDHYLGKEFMHNLLVMRFHNDIIQSLWNRNNIEYIQIMFDETHGVDQRLGFYEKIGVVRDTVQNHILQIIAYLTMGEPLEFTPESIAAEKLKALMSIKPVKDFRLAKYATLGSDEERDINIPTYAALKLSVENFAFSGVPIYVRTGKMQEQARSQIYIKFKSLRRWAQVEERDTENAIIITVHPEMNIDIALNMKEPNSDWKSRPVKFTFNHSNTFKVNTPEAYEQILAKILIGDKSLFPSMGEICQSWKIVEPMLDGAPVETYEDRTLPDCAQQLVASDGVSWYE